MGMIINISEALKNRTEYNILREPLNDMLQERQEAWEKKNPVDLLFIRGTLDKFQETYTDNIGFEHAFAETGDMGIAPIFNTAEGFSTTYTSRTFQGGFKITQQVIEDKQYGKVQTDASKFINRWHGDIVEFAMTAISSGFGKQKEFVCGGFKSVMQLKSADTTTGDINAETKNPLFSINHNVVKRDGMTYQDVMDSVQSNIYSVVDGKVKGIDVAGSDAGMLPKLADLIDQVITNMENYKDDNRKYAGVEGSKVIVAPNDARLKAALSSVLSLNMFEVKNVNTPNPAYQRATLETTPYLKDIDCCYDNAKKKALGFFIIDKAYNEANHGPEFTERIPLTMNVEEIKNPYHISYDARQRFDVNVASWRGISYVYIGADEPTFISSPLLTSNGTTEAKTGFEATTPVEVVATIATPVKVISDTEPLKQV